MEGADVDEGEGAVEEDGAVEGVCPMFRCSCCMAVCICRTALMVDGSAIMPRNCGFDSICWACGLLFIKSRIIGFDCSNCVVEKRSVSFFSFCFLFCFFFWFEEEGGTVCIICGSDSICRM